jgi:NAD(P)-dependent dehydrogenase (short-subunit alcohol dehydrogenase family)
MNVTFNFSDKIALVTGGGSGIGRASSVAFGGAGATVIVADISEDNGRATAEHIVHSGGKAEFRSVDVADESSVQCLDSRIERDHGRLDIAHNNAGIEGMTMAKSDRRESDVGFLLPEGRDSFDGQEWHERGDLA